MYLFRLCLQEAIIGFLGITSVAAIYSTEALRNMYKEGINSHLLGSMEHEESTIKISNLTKRVYDFEKIVQALQDYINNKDR